MNEHEDIAQDLTEEPDAQPLSLLRNLKIGLFHLGSGMADVLTTGVWNRIMISDFGLSATPVALLLSLRYFLIPIGIWSGEISDRRRILGTRRMFWIWSGRALMLLGMALTGWQTVAITHTLHNGARGSISSSAWLIFVLAILLFSLGSALSGSTFLAFLYDRAPRSQRGQAVGIVWAFLLFGFMFAGILFGILLPENGVELPQITPGNLRSLFLISVGLIGVLWFVSLLGEERKSQVDRASANTAMRKGQIRADLAFIWRQPKLRYFIGFLIVTFIFAFMQDIVLEPFGGDVFSLSLDRTARFSAYWGGMSIVSMVVVLSVNRKVERISHIALTTIGTLLLTLSFVMFSIAALFGISAFLIPGLLVLGLGLGIWNVGTLGLMMDFSPHGRAGTFMGIWTMVITLARGFGVLAGGLFRDILLVIGLPLAGAYGGVFLFEVVGLVASLLLLLKVRQTVFASKNQNSQAKVALPALAEALDS